MKRGLALACLIVLGTLVIAKGPAYAGATLFTGPVPFETSQGQNCSAVNVGGHDLQVEVSAFCSNGDSSLAICSPLSPGDICGAGVIGFATSLSNCHCEISVTGGGKKAVRATLCNVTTGSCSDAR